MPKNLFIIGISGVTCGGKTTLATELHQLLPNSRIISQDDYFLDKEDPRHIWVPEINHINFDVPSSLDMDQMYRDIKNMAKNKTILKVCKRKSENIESFQDLSNLKLYVYEKISRINDLEILIIEGFLIFNYKPLVQFFHLKYYMTLPRDVCLERREKRTYEPPDCPGYFEKCVWPEYLKQLDEVRKGVAEIRYFNDGDIKSSIKQVLFDVANIL